MRIPFTYRVLILILSLGGPGFLNAQLGSQEPIPWSRLGAAATEAYTGDAVGIAPTSEGVHLRSGFQKLAGTVTDQGLILISTVAPARDLRLTASAFGRGNSLNVLSLRGTVTSDDATARFIRPALTEEYSVSVDGVRQDFILDTRPAGDGELLVHLALQGAVATQGLEGTVLTMDGSGRELAYGRLLVTDAIGQQLMAVMDVVDEHEIVIRVHDASATYPIRIDPTFSDANWVSMNSGLPGANGLVQAIAIDSNGDLYIGGTFTFVGNVPANQIAKWDGTSWSALGVGVAWGVQPGTVSSLLANGTDIYVGGTFTTAGGITVNHIAKWDGANWSALGSGLNGQQALAMAWMGSELIVGGGFLSAGGVANTSRLAKWNGTTWSSLGVGTTDSNVQALLVDGTDLYVAGGFTTLVGFPANRIAKWDGSTWSSLGTGMNGQVLSLAKNGTDLYAGGGFTTAGGTTAFYIAKWNGGSWSALSGGGMNAAVWALAFHGSYLYAGGQFTAPALNLARWNGTAWSAVGGSTNGQVRALTLYGGDLYIGGAFNIVTGTTANYIARYDGSTITAFGTGINTSVVALAHDGTDLYVGGAFTQAGGVAAPYVAKWDGSSWSALGAGMNGTVYVLTFIGGDLYAGGDFTTAGGAPANRIAKWNGSSWTGLGTGTNGRVRAIAPFGPDIIVGGEFTSAGGLANTGYIAKWTGAAWNVMATGVNGNVLALHPSGADLYAGGDFTTMSGVSASKVAKWNGSSWSALGIGLTSTVTSLATIGTELFAGGAFTLVGPPFITTNRVAKWDGSAWSALGTALNNTVRSLAVHGTDLIAVGDFTTAGGAPANRVAKWNGSAWSAFGSGVDNNVNRVIVVGDDMYVGGNFLHAGGQVSPWLARGILGPDSDGDGTVDELDDCPFAVDGIADFDANTCACNLGYYATITDIDGNDVITACTICPPGYFCADGLSSQPCPAGSFSATSGQQACQLCAVNTYNPTIAQTECLACPNGEISDVGATECTPDLTCITDLDIIFQPDGVSDIGWELRQQGSDILVQSGNGVYPASPGYSLATCLPDGCFYLVVTDDGGDGITGGGYQLRVNSSGRLIDNLRDAFGNGGFTTGSVSQVANGEGFCLPLGQDRLIFTSCDKLDWKTGPCGGEYVVANDNDAVTAQYGVNDATSGYQLWWFDPNGGYSFRRFQSHSTNNGLPVSATRACGFRLNNWSGNQLAQGVLYNVKVRGRVNGTFLPWGPACRLMLDDAAAQCPRTKLMDIPGNQFLSCGATRPVANNAYVHARSVRRMQGNCTYLNANRYQFRFRIIAENFVLVKTSATGQYFVNTLGLACGKTYEVDVRASFDNGATWCDASGAGLNDPAWGDVCLLTTSNCLTGGGQSIALQGNGVNGTLAMYPNPNRGDQLFINLTQVEDGVNTVSADIYDGFGKRVAARTIAVTDGYLNTVLELNGELATGMYLVNITAGGTVHTERLVIQP